MSDPQKAVGVAVFALGLSQALAPQTAARAFGLDPLDDQAAWVARLLGIANMGLASLSLDPSVRSSARTATRGVLAGNALATLAAGASGGIPKRTVGSVLAFVAALAAAEVAGD